MAFVIRCYNCRKISKGNYINKPNIEKKKEFKSCVDNNHNIKIEKVY